MRARAVILALTCAAVQAHAVTLVSYSADELTTSSHSLSPDEGSVIAGLEASDAFDNVTTNLSDSGFSSSSHTYFARVGYLASTSADAITAADYVEFTLDPTTDYQMDIDSISFLLGATLSQGQDVTVNVTVRSSLDSYSSDLDDVSFSLSNPGTSGNITEYEAQTVTLSSADFDGLTGPVTFRLYVWAADTASQSFLRIDNIVAAGSVTSIPEPASAMSAALAVLLVCLLRRRCSRR